MTTTQQRLAFMKRLRDNKKAIRQLHILLEYPIDTLELLLRGVNDDVHAMRLLEVGQKVSFCKCGKPITNENRVACAVDPDGNIKVYPGEPVCFDCAIEACGVSGVTKRLPEYKFENPKQ